MRRLSRSQTRAVGAAALGFSLLYFATDVVEAIEDGFSDWQLWLTLVAELAIPLFVLGLYLAQRPRIGRLGLIGALAYAYAFLFFSCTVVYALAEGTPDYDALSDDLGAMRTATQGAGTAPELVAAAVRDLAFAGMGAALLRGAAAPAGSAKMPG